MLKKLAAFKVAGGPAAHRQVEAFVREAIRSRQFPPGTRLPSARELGARWGLSPRTVHLGLTTLVKEGWLQRTPRRGTFVRRRERRLTCVGVYYPQDVWRHPAMEFGRSLHGELKTLLDAQGVELQAWIDPRSAADAAQPWDEFVDAAQARRYQGFVAPLTDPAHLQWLTELNLPSVYVTSAPLPNVVGFDLAQFADLALDTLVERGVKSVALICALSPATSGHALMGRAGVDFYDHFIEACRRRGLEMRDRWMRVPGGATLHADEHEPFGFRAFEAIWSQAPHPEGLVVYPDSMAKGVLMALLSRQVRVPEALKLVLHRNAGVPLFCPVEASMAVSSERDAAAAIWRQLQRQFQGETVKPVLLPFRLESSDNRRRS